MEDLRVISFYCPYCGKKTIYTRESNPLGKQKKCKGCGKNFAMTEETMKEKIGEPAWYMKEGQASGLPQISVESKAGLPTPSQVMREEKEALKQGFAKMKGIQEKNDSKSLSPGEMFGEHYRIERILGQGGMGIVYQAMDIKLDRLVALKLILPKEEIESRTVKRFLQEARNTAQIKHPNIVRIYEVGEEPMPYFTMEFIAGTTLQEWIKKNPNNYRGCAEIFCKVTEALQEVHKTKIIHRDIKPSNIMVDNANSPKLMDFGLAKNMDIQKSLSLSGTVLGTPAYMPPEQAKGEKADFRSDVYSMGAALYECLTLSPPFSGNYGQVWNQVVHKDPVNPSQLNPKVPIELEAICLKCIQKSPENRYQTSHELAGDIKNYLENRPLMARPLTVFSRCEKWITRNKAWSIAIGTVSLLILILATMLTIFWQWGKEEIKQLEIEKQRAQSTFESIQREKEKALELQKNVEKMHKNNENRKLKEQRKIESTRLTKTSQDARYRVLASGIIQDTKTGLEWLVGRDQNTTWDEAKSWVESIDPSKYGKGWRMPTMKELKGIYEKGKGGCNIDPVFIPGFVFTDFYLRVWSGELVGSSTLFFNFPRCLDTYANRESHTDLRAFAVCSEKRKFEEPQLAKAARKAKETRLEGDTRYRVLSSGIIQDTKTGMEWLVGPDYDTTWDEANECFIDSTQYGTDWRIPTKEELSGIYEKGKGECNIDPVFVSPRNLLWVWVWNEKLIDSSSSCSFNFHTGRENWLNGSGAARVFFVRPGRQ